MSDSNSVCSHATDEEVVEALNTLLTSLKLKQRTLLNLAEPMGMPQ